MYLLLTAVEEESTFDQACAWGIEWLKLPFPYTAIPVQLAPFDIRIIIYFKPAYLAANHEL